MDRAPHKQFPEVLGRVARDATGHIGRFGWKAQIATLEEFTLTACAVELGLEVPDHPQAGDAQQPDYAPTGLDLTKRQCQSLVAFVAGLPRPIETRSIDGNYRKYVAAGRGLFIRIGCAECHLPVLGNVDGLFSDLLLHRMSESKADVGSYGVFRREVADATGPRRMRNWPGRQPPPSGELRRSGVAATAYMHDGSAATLEQAVAMHGGEARKIAKSFLMLKSAEQLQLLAFLKSLAAP